MTNEEMIEQLEQAIGLIKQDGKDWLDDRDIPIIEACIKSLTALDKIRAEIANYQKEAVYSNDVVMTKRMVLAIIDKIRAEIANYQKEALYSDDVVMTKRMVLAIIDKYKAESEE